MKKRAIQKEYEAPEELRQILLGTPEELRKKSVVDWLSKHDIDVKEEDVIILKGCIPVLKDDTTFKYPESRLEWLLDDVSNIIRKHSKPLETAMDAEHVEKHYTHETGYNKKGGWDGEEGIPWTVAEAWDRYGFVDFRGHDISNPQELAAMWSIYRNPAIEYSHIVLLKDNQIVHQTMMTSGLYTLTMAIPAAGFVALKKRFRNIDFDDMYILHNHPDRDNAVSPADLSIAAGYYKTFGSRFKGSIVLEKTGFQILKPIGPSSPFSRKVDLLPLSFMYENQPWKEHDPGPAQRLDDKDMGYDGRLADWIRKNSGSWPVCRSIVEGRASGAAVAYMDTERRLIDFQPFDAEFGFPSQIAESTVRKRAASATLVTGDPRLYEKLKKKAMSESKHKRSPVRDIILVLPGNYRSMRQENRKYRSSDPRDTIPTKRFNDIIRNEGRNVVVDTGVISITEKLRRKAVKESGSRTGRKGNERI